MEKYNFLQKNQNFNVFKFCKKNNIECSWDFNDDSAWTEVHINDNLLFQFQDTTTVEQFIEIIKLLYNDLNPESVNNTFVGDDFWWGFSGSESNFKKFIRIYGYVFGIENVKPIMINIWDDFYEDGDVPEGEKQETFAYVEDGDLSHEITKKCLKILLNHIKNNIKPKNIKMSLKFHDYQNDYNGEEIKKIIENYGDNFFIRRWELVFKNITHEELDKMMKRLKKSKLSFNKIPFDIYSES